MKTIIKSTDWKEVVAVIDKWVKDYNYEQRKNRRATKKVNSK